MAQNIYDNKDFFDNYVQLDRQTKGLEGAPEWPQLRAMLPADLRGLHLLDLGCGMGWVCRWALENGAASAHGVDLSQNMLAKAHEMGSTLSCSRSATYEQADLDSLSLPPDKYDIVFSSLAFHYLLNLPQLMAQISRALRAGGRLVFSVEHPIFTAPHDIFAAPLKAGMRTDDTTGRRYWPVDAYQHEGQRLRSWFVDGVRKQHRTMATYIRILLDEGFELTDCVEWCPSAEELEAAPEWASEMIRPTFLLVGATMKGQGKICESIAKVSI
ncbi:putative methyltransferase [Microdochium bolleyi]|uniref:Putative methyltransferase n=1 Tax=Microdochium bolleyi TaxID=196109 RepID=A0A136J3Z8_9PEZI|nr:putative methyltransferase [Microdochium bolleyi]